MTDDELRRLEWKRKAAQKKADAATQARNEAVRAALDEGWTHARIAAALGVSRGRISQLVLPSSSR